MPSNGYCLVLAEWRKQEKVTNIRTEALPETRAEGTCYHHQVTYISYHNGVRCAKVKQPEVQGEFPHFSYAFSIAVSRYKDEAQHFLVILTDKEHKAQLMKMPLQWTREDEWCKAAVMLMSEHL